MCILALRKNCFFFKMLNHVILQCHFSFSLYYNVTDSQLTLANRQSNVNTELSITFQIGFTNLKHHPFPGSVIGCRLDTEVVVKRRILNKLLSIKNNPDHPLRRTLDTQWSTFSKRLRQLCYRSDCCRKSLQPQAISL